jgi:hypothetical protein
MDDARVAAWTRRRFGLVVGGLAATLAGLADRDDAAAKHKHHHKHKKKCKSQQVRCGKQCVTGDCCPGQPCGESGQDCACGHTIDGAAFCFEQSMALCQQCESNAECIEPFRCVQVSDCDAVTAICRPACGTVF